VSAIPEASVRPITFAVTCLPDSPEAHLWTIEVAHRGRNLWAATRMGDCLGASGEWEGWESPEHRFPLDRALEVAKAAAPGLTVNQWTVAAAIEREATR
jgi:hypothetical protein